MLIYNLAVRLYGLLIKLAAFRKPKAAQWVAGRKNWRQQLEGQCKKLNKAKTVWVHCASYGEFEQGRPLIEAIKSSHSDYSILLTFFSPSGYEAFKDWKGADVICYLPLDTKKNASDFLRMTQPKMAIFIKYEFWVNFLFEIKRNNIPSFLVSSVFKPHHPFFKWYGSIFRKSLRSFTQLFVQDQASASLLKSIQINNVQIAGDTRFDRVLKVKEGNTENVLLKEFKANNRVIIAGSTWPGDDEIVLTAFKKLQQQNVKLIIAPHETDSKSITGLVKKLSEHDLSYSLYTETISNSASVLVINTIGLLSKSYFYADCAYIGGGFNGGLHNVLEPAVFNIPVSFYGDKFHKYNEAVQLVALEAANPVKSEIELESVFNKHLFNEEYRKITAKKIQTYFEENGNATEKILMALPF